jgi:hypothetical protein
MRVPVFVRPYNDDVEGLFEPVPLGRADLAGDQAQAR